MAQIAPIRHPNPVPPLFVVPVDERAAPELIDERERARLWRLVESLLAVRSAAAFTHWTATELQTVLPHGMMVCGLAEVRTREVRVSKMLSRQWPAAYFDALRRPDGSFQSPILARWQVAQAPQLYDPQRDAGVDNRPWEEVFNDFRLGNLAVHGLRDVGSSLGSYFKFARLPELLSPRHGRLLELLTPHMHVALVRVLAEVPEYSHSGSTPPVRLTPRERDVLGWMVEGKTNWEIAQIGGRSEHTVRHQVGRLLVKLNASNRAQAVARALSLRLLVH